MAWIWSPPQTNSVMPMPRPPLPSMPIKLPLQKQRLQMSEPVCLQAEAPSPRKREHDVPKPKNPIVLQASILTRKVEEKFSKKFGFCHLQKSGFCCEPQSEPQANLRGQKITRKIRKTPDFLSKSGVFMANLLFVDTMHHALTVWFIFLDPVLMHWDNGDRKDKTSIQQKE